MRIKEIITVTALVASSLLATTGTAVAASDGTNAARSATARYHNIANAVADGYRLLTDAAGIACIDKPGVGAMGVHYVKGSLVGDPRERARTPELLVYEPRENGRMRLVALEYVVFQSDWQQAGHTALPSLFGQTFAPVAAGNRFGLPAFYELHAWIWKHNPSGKFADFNPSVSCEDD